MAVARRAGGLKSMTVLYGPLDSLPPTARRILVTGSSGAGKSTLRETISTILHLPTVEIDSLHHGPNWTPRPTFAADVDHFTSGPNWVIEWQYSQVRALLLGRADILIWLDHSRWTVAHRVVRRTLRRPIHRIELWNGNHEPPLRTIFTDGDHIIRWAWRTHHKRRHEALDVASHTGSPLVVRLAGQTQVDAWVRGPLQQLTDHDPSAE
jgi:adenylate kinase family enzyme